MDFNKLEKQQLLNHKYKIRNQNHFGWKITLRSSNPTVKLVSNISVQKKKTKTPREYFQSMNHKHNTAQSFWIFKEEVTK